LTAFFAAIVLLMIVGDAIAVLQLDRVETRAWRFYRADQKSLAVMHVYLDVVTFRDTLTGLAHDQNSHEFASRATALRDSFLRDVTHAQQTLNSTPDFSQDPTILIRLETVRTALPAQVDTLLELVKVEDWQAVRFRLPGQMQSLIALSSSLVADVEQEVAQERARALDSIQRTRRQLYLVLPTTALLILLMAATLGWYATRRISRPLAQLDAGAQALARGEFGYEIELSGNDELADLARAFNYATQQLHKLYDVIKRSEANLAESNAKLEEAQRITHVGYWEWDILTGRVNWSDETYRIYGLRPQERPMDLATVQEKIHPEDWRRGMEEALGGARFNAECRLFRPTGEVRIAHFQGDVKREASGRPYQMFGTVQDITDRKRAEEALQQSQFYLAEGQRLAHMGSWVFNPAGFFSHWPRELFQIYGLDPAQEAPDLEEYLALIHPQDREFMRSLISRMVADATGCDVTKRIVRPNGEVRFVRCVGVPVVENGNPKRIVGTAIDVTEQELLTQELERRQAYLAEAQELSHTGSFGWKPETGEIVWSDETYRIFEYDPALKPTIDLLVERVHPEDRADFQKVIERASAGSTHFEHAYRLLLPDGRIKHIHALAHATRDAFGNREFVGAGIDVTERKRAEEALRRSENYLAEAQRLTHMGSWAWQLADREAMHLSEEWYRIYGFDPKQGVPAWEERLQRVHPEDRDKWRGTLERAIREKSDYEVEFRILLPDGTLKWVHTVGHPVLSAAGELDRFVGSSMDVTERKLAEQTLRESEAYLAEAQRLSQTGSWAWNPATQEIRHWSEECCRIFGFEPGEPLPPYETFLQRIYPDDQIAFSEQSEKAIRERAGFEMDYRILHPKRGIRDIHVVGHAVLSPSGDLVEFVGTVIDITERKRAEEELQQLVDFVPQVIVVLEPDGKWILANRVAREYMGLTMEECRTLDVIGKVAHPDDMERMRAARENGFFVGDPFELEARLLGKDGVYRWFLFRYNPLVEHGCIRRWYVTGTEIESRKQAEERLRNENIALREEISKASMFEEIVGASPALRMVLSRVSKVAPTASTVLITGETGTGKELIARAIHRRSERCSRPFVSVNCAAIPRDLIASELFGHEKGAFTGALQRRLGKFELAEGGTIFLDEIGELPAEMQIALLRVLQEHEFERVGGNQTIRADVRVIAATNRDLQAAIADGIFRTDLFYRLNVFPIEVPPLRERKDDIPMLVEYFIDRFARQSGKKITSIDKKTLALIQAYPWPGNIRELQNVIERSVVLAETETFFVDESWLSPASPSLQSSNTMLLSKKPALQEKEIIEAALAETKGRVSGPAGAAAKLGVPSTTLESKIKSLKINKHQYKTA